MLKDYIEKNKSFDLNLGVVGWETMLRKANNVSSILECGCNIGRNINFLNNLLPQSKKSFIEISKPAFDIVSATYQIEKAFNGSILDSSFENKSFNLVFTCGCFNSYSYRRFTE